jgi:hypothetical protein
LSKATGQPISTVVIGTILFAIMGLATNWITAFLVVGLVHTIVNKKTAQMIENLPDPMRTYMRQVLRFLF